MYIPDLSQAFTDGHKVSAESLELTLKTVKIGDVVLPTGRLIACDPFVYRERGPFTTSVPTGTYPVILSIAKVEPEDDQRVAYAMIKFAEGVAVKWEMAIMPDEDVTTLEEDEIFGYGVDSGTGCFMDEAAATVFLEKEEDYDEELLEKLETNYQDTWSHISEVLDSKTGANIVAFSSGWGDGGYASYFGYDEAGKLVHIITDFGVVIEEDVVIN